MKVNGTENTEPVSRMNYIYVDYENVQNLDLELIDGKPVKVFLVVGHQRKTFPKSLTKQLLKYHDQVTLIESEGATTNALDLVLAYHVGLQAAADPNGYFHILAKDHDYDALIAHLRASGRLATRQENFAWIPALVVIPELSLAEQVEWVIARLERNKSARPKRMTSLLTTIHSLCRKELSEQEVQKIADALVSRKLVEAPVQGDVLYNF